MSQNYLHSGRNAKKTYISTHSLIRMAESAKSDVRGPNMGVCTAIGIAIGASVGVATGALALGTAIGAAIGVAVGAIQRRRSD